MKLKVDMAIQNMIQDESKQYSLIVVVVDSRLKMVDLPLDLQTLNPILFCERYYEYRLSNAFQSTVCLYTYFFGMFYHVVRMLKR